MPVTIVKKSPRSLYKRRGQEYVGSPLQRCVSSSTIKKKILSVVFLVEVRRDSEINPVVGPDNRRFIIQNIGEKWYRFFSKLPKRSEYSICSCLDFDSHEKDISVLLFRPDLVTESNRYFHLRNNIKDISRKKKVYRPDLTFRYVLHVPKKRTTS